MKKTITINIAGLVFHIEEDAYHELLTYLNSIGEKFRNEIERQEIIEDIEIRISELFTEKLNEYKQVITSKDVNDVIEIMGTPDWFNDEESEEKEQTKSSSNKETKKLYRDTNRKQISGVCAGIAHYFNIEVTIIRVIFAVSLFLGGIGFILYIIFWAILPENKNIKSEEISKKFYRDIDNKLISGVCSGIANYFGIDVSIIRVILVAFVIFGGFGLFLYIILWIVIPEAKTISEKLSMKGKKADLKNIEAFFRNFKSNVTNMNKKDFSDNVKKKSNQLKNEVVKFGKSIKPEERIKSGVNILEKVIYTFIGVIFLLIGISFSISSLFAYSDLSNINIIKVNSFNLSVDTLSKYIENPTWLVVCLITLILTIGVGFLIASLKLLFYNKKNVNTKIKPLSFLNKSVFILTIIGFFIIVFNNKLSYTKTSNSEEHLIKFKNINIKKLPTNSLANNNITFIITKKNISTPILKITKSNKGISSKKTPFTFIDYKYEINDSTILLSPKYKSNSIITQQQQVKVNLIIPENDSSINIVNNF